MLMFDKKRNGGVAIDVSKSKKDEEVGSDADLKMIAEELIASVKTGDTQGTVLALKAFFMACEASEDEGEYE